jgi:hypothetical protein
VATFRIAAQMRMRKRTRMDVELLSLSDFDHKNTPFEHVCTMHVDGFVL